MDVINYTVCGNVVLFHIGETVHELKSSWYNISVRDGVIMEAIITKNIEEYLDIVYPFILEENVYRPMLANYEVITKGLVRVWDGVPWEWDDYIQMLEEHDIPLGEGYN